SRSAAPPVVGLLQHGPGTACAPTDSFDLFLYAALLQGALTRIKVVPEGLRIIEPIRMCLVARSGSASRGASRSMSGSWTKRSVDRRSARRRNNRRRARPSVTAGWPAAALPRFLLTGRRRREERADEGVPAVHPGRRLLPIEP